VVAKTKSQWDIDGLTTSEPGVLYVTTDYRTITKDDTTYEVPAFRLGDGNAYVVDLPYMTVDE